MDIHTSRQAAASEDFRASVKAGVDLSLYDISFSVIDSVCSRVISVSTNYDWHICYWDHDLDMRLNQRLITGIRTWQKYDGRHLQVFEDFLPDRKTKIDICTRHKTSYELMSISSSHQIELFQMIELLKFKPAVSAMMKQICRKRDDELALPLRVHCSDKVITKISECHVSKQKQWHFGDITFTTLEMDSIRQLMMCRSIKEIAWTHHCGVKTEQKRISNIKLKAGCPSYPNSKLFDILKQNGVTQACLDTFIIYQ